MVSIIKKKSFLKKLSSGISLPFASIIIVTIVLAIAFQGLKSFLETRTKAATAPGVWTNVTSNLANMPSQCGNLTMLSAIPGSNTVIAGVALDGLWASTNNGTSWSQMGTGSGSDTIVNRPSWISYDPTNSQIFWESGIYNSNGVYKTTDGGNTFQHLGNITHLDYVSVDFSDPNRQTLVTGGHEESQTVYKSTDGGQTWTNIGVNLPAGTGFSSSPVIINAQTYIVNTNPSWGGGSPGIYRTTDSGTTWQQVSIQGPPGPPLIASNGTIYWPNNGGLLKSTDEGITWTQVGSGLQSVHPIEMPDGNLVSVGGSTLVISSDGGSTWTPIGPTLPYNPAGVIYSPNDQAFYIWQWDCGNVILPNAIMELNYNYGSTSPSSTPNTTPTPTVTPQPTPTPVITGSATLSITPPTQGVIAGQTVSINLTENSGSNSVNALQTTISYSSNLLTETGISYGSAFGVKAVEDITPGSISISRGSTTPVTGTNTVATITFQTNSSGNAPLTLSSSQIFSSITNQDIFSTATNGTITIAAPSPTPTPTPIAIIGDINSDGVVDLLDVSILLSNWGQTNQVIATNLGNSGVVGIRDLSILLSHWGL